MKLDPKIGRSLKKASPTILTCIGAAGVVATAALAVKATPKADILALPDGSIVSGKIESWKDYDDGDQIQVKIDGTTYLVHSVNIVLIKE